MALKIKKIRPLFNMILTTMDTYAEDQTIGGIIDATKQSGTLKEYQRVVAVGDTVRNIKDGDLVNINPKRYAQVKHKKGSLNDGIVQDNPVISYNFNTVEVDDKQLLVLYDQDINFVIEDSEEVEDPTPSALIHPNNDIIIP